MRKRGNPFPPRASILGKFTHNLDLLKSSSGSHCLWSGSTLIVRTQKIWIIWPPPTSHDMLEQFNQIGVIITLCQVQKLRLKENE